MLPASLVAFGVIFELRRIKTQLLGDEGAYPGWGLLALLEYPSGETQIAEHESEAKTIRIAASATDQSQILWTEGVVAHHSALIAGGSLKIEPLRLGKQFLMRHGCPC